MAKMGRKREKKETLNLVFFLPLFHNTIFTISVFLHFAISAAMEWDPSELGMGKDNGVARGMKMEPNPRQHPSTPRAKWNRIHANIHLRHRLSTSTFLNVTGHRYLSHMSIPTVILTPAFQFRCNLCHLTFMVLHSPPFTMPFTSCNTPSKSSTIAILTRHHPRRTPSTPSVIHVMQ